MGEHLRGGGLEHRKGVPGEEEQSCQMQPWVKQEHGELPIGSESIECFSLGGLVGGVRAWLVVLRGQREGSQQG